MIALAATTQYRPPQVTHPLAKRTQRRAVHGHPVIAKVTQQDRAQVRSLFPNGRVRSSASPAIVGSRSEVLALDTRSFGKTAFRLISGTLEAMPGIRPRRSIIK